MKKTDCKTQLKINFSSDNKIAEALRAGSFQVWLEYNVPLHEQPEASAFELGLGIARMLRQQKLVTGIAVTDRLQAEDCHDPVQAAEKLMTAAEKPAILYLSGKGSGHTRLRDLTARAVSAGIRNIVAVTGDRSEKHVKRNFTGRLLPYHAGYLDSVETLRLLAKTGNKLCLGAGVNPFKYNPADIYLQYFKMMRKLNTGAEFLVTNSGWDMKKIQELQWYLDLRGWAIPVIARLPLISHAAARDLNRGLVPGVSVSKSMAALVERESNVSSEQWFAAQLPRIALQAAGCRILGCSGIQISGLHDARSAETVLEQIAAAFSAYPNYNAWLDAWKQHHEGIDFNPLGSAGHYVFKDLLTKGAPKFDPEESVVSECQFPEPSFMDRCRSRSLRLVDLVLSRGDDHSPGLAGFIFCGKCGGSCLDRQHSYYLCARDCPKNLNLGACGGSFADGTCEFGQGPCFFHRVLALASKRRELDTLESGV